MSFSIENKTCSKLYERTQQELYLKKDVYNFSEIKKLEENFKYPLSFIREWKNGKFNSCLMKIVNVILILRYFKNKEMDKEADVCIFNFYPIIK